VRELLEFLARGLVEDPDAVIVDEIEEVEGEVVLELEVAEGDLGRVIGRGGRVANALRTVMKAAAVREEKRVIVDIID
jgi:predicted RNA-binding protein YlqC (UPF0109 family)